MVVFRDGRPVAEIRPLNAAPGPRPIGLAAGEFVVPDDFDDPLPDDLLDAFEGPGPRATEVSTTETELLVRLADGRTIIVPLAWYPRFLNATAEQRAQYELLGDGEYIHWPQIDEDLTVRGLLRGTPAPQKTGG